MALTSVYYDGTVTETDRAQNLAGAPQYGVYGVEDFRVTAHPTIPYAVIVKAGRAHGHGVTDTATIDQVVNCDPAPAGTVRWDMIVVNRNWQPALGGPSVLKAIPVGAIADMPSSRKNSPGVEDEQPIALVKWAAGLSAPQAIMDLRVWAGNGGLYAKEDLVRQYLTEVGTEVTINGSTWNLVLGANDMKGWSQNVPPQLDGIPAGSKPIIKSGNVVVNTTGYGDAYYSFPQPFPSTMVACVGSDATDPAYWPALTLKFAAVYSDKSRFCFRVYDAAGNILANKANLNISYIATGY